MVLVFFIKNVKNGNDKQNTARKTKNKTGNLNGIEIDSRTGTIAENATKTIELNPQLEKVSAL
mgnify:CR=1 FL=1